ncbi:MAG: hypothetical protein IPH78_05225 [Bacteroidetes bacterium]|nr:hypothetical protein [Bacteroidota bacterium]MBK8658281.1 hypothetical protein [Bacteroidota bacterium]
MNNLNKILGLTFLLMVGFAYITNAQVPPPGNTTPSAVPIDGGVISIVGASIAYGAKKLYDKNKAKKGE